MEPIDYVRALVRRWPIIAIGALIGAAFAFLGTDPKPAPMRPAPTRRPTRCSITEPTQFGHQPLVGTITFAQVPVFATTGEVPRLVAEELGYEGAPASLAAQLQVDADQETGTLRFTTSRTTPSERSASPTPSPTRPSATSPQRQQDIRQERQTKALEDVDQLEAEIRELDQTIADQLAAQNAATGRRGIRPPRRTRSPRPSATPRCASTPPRTRRTDRSPSRKRATSTSPRSSGRSRCRCRRAGSPRRAPARPVCRSVPPSAPSSAPASRCSPSASTPRSATGARPRKPSSPVVAELPTLNRKQRAARLVVAPTEHHPAAEAFRSLRTSITFMAAGGHPLADDDRVGAVLVTSPSPAEGKTTIAVNLAAAFAETGRSVVLVNADFRRPCRRRSVTDERPPLPAASPASTASTRRAFLVPTRIPGVQLLDLAPLGGAPGDLTRATVRLVSALVERVDVIVVDTPPLAVTTEALEFVPASKVVVLVGRIGRTATAAAPAGRRAGPLRWSRADRRGPHRHRVDAPSPASLLRLLRRTAAGPSDAAATAVVAAGRLPMPLPIALPTEPDGRRRVAGDRRARRAR